MFHLERLAQTLESERLLLRAFEPRDARRLLAVVDQNRAHLERWLMWPVPMTSVQALEQWAARPYDASEPYRMGVFTKADGELIGAAGLKRRSIDPRSDWSWVDVNYWLAASATGHGSATEATRRLAEHAFDDLAAPRVEIRAEPANLSSTRVAERLGFKLEGVLRAVGHRRGAAVDLALYALLPGERALLR
jgi:RimJ/RimL family protein N-acetyltransferase